jgi:hypothetical protein
VFVRQSVTTTTTVSTIPKESSTNSSSSSSSSTMEFDNSGYSEMAQCERVHLNRIATRTLVVRFVSLTLDDDAAMSTKPDYKKKEPEKVTQVSALAHQPNDVGLKNVSFSCCRLGFDSRYRRFVFEYWFWTGLSHTKYFVCS